MLPFRALAIVKRFFYTPLLAFPFASRNKKLNTQVFSELSYSQISNPKFTKALIIKPIHMHSRVSQRSLFHEKRVGGRILSCFSEKKHKVFRRVHKLKRSFYSNTLKQMINVTVSTKAFRTIKKMGSFDNYILCTKPKNLDSKYGEYLRQLMLRKINDPNFKIPYIVGTDRKKRVKKYQRHLYIKSLRKITIPKQFKSNFRTLQRQFGKSLDQLNSEDYAKYVELQNLKKTLGDELQPTHPLIVQLKQKMKPNMFTQEQENRLEEMSKQAEENYVNDKRFGEANRKKVQKAKHEIQMMNLKVQEIRYRLNQF